MAKYGFSFGIAASCVFGAALVATGCGGGFDGCEERGTCSGSAAGSAGSAGQAGSAGRLAASGTSGTRGGSVGESTAGGRGGGDTPAKLPESEGGEGGIPDGELGAGAPGQAGTGEPGTAEGGAGGSETGLGVAGAAAEGGEGGVEGDPNVDTTGPTIVSVSPRHKSGGVRADAELVITFSEPMDRVTTQAAYQSADIPAASVTFEWNADGTVLTAVPIGGLGYAKGTLDDFPRSYAISLTSTATDRAGNPLERFDWAFSTLRRIIQVLPATNPSQCENDHVRLACDPGTDECASLDIAVSLSEIPQGIVEWGSATWSGAVTSIGLDGPAGFGGQYMLSHLVPNGADFLSAELERFSTRVGAFQLEIGRAVLDDYVHRETRDNRARFRLAEARDRSLDLDDGDVVFSDFSCSDFKLTLSYLIP